MQNSAANLPHESGATKAAAEESVPIQNSFGPGFTSQLSSPLSPPLLAPGRPYSPTTTTYDTTTTHHYHPPPTITMAAAASPSYLRSSSNNTPAVKLHPPAANRLYFTWLPLNYFFTSWFSVGAPPTPLVAIGRCHRHRRHDGCRMAKQVGICGRNNTPMNPFAYT